MGIPGLLTCLEPYAARFTSDELDGYSAVVDGPAFAYHAHKLAADANKTRLPSYADVHVVALRWLKSLEATNIKVSAILFDGALPSSKKAERSSRLQQMIRRVIQFRKSCPTAACPVPISLGSTTHSFLAPSLVEMLRNSPFSDRTRIVPGEADDWCAAYAVQVPRSIIFTGDSDLFLYEYPPEALIMFFRDVHDIPRPDSKMYSPYTICQRLELANLSLLAYAISEDKWKSFNENVQIARQCDRSSQTYLDFSNRYYRDLQVIESALPIAELNDTLQSLDVRVSEFVHQALVCSDISLAPDVYLPLLLEDPNETSAWKLGLNVRLLAYTLVLPRSNRVIREYTRRAQDAAVQVHALLSLDAAKFIMADLVQVIRPWLTRQQIPVWQRWYLIAFKVAVDVTKVPHTFLLARVINNEFDNSWSFVHLNARLQAVLYSLRMLKQCIAVWSVMDNAFFDQEALTLISNLADDLKQLPSIEDLFRIPGQSKHPLNADVDLSLAIRDVYSSAGIGGEELFEEPKSKRQKKRDKERRRREDRAKEKNSQETSSNIFALLERKGNA